MSVESVGTIMQRVSLRTFEAPAAARTVDVAIVGHLAATRPQVTWTTSLRPWEVGGASDAVLIDGFSAAQRHLDGRSGLLRNANMVLREVG